MTQVLQWLNGYALIWIPALLAVGCAGLLIYRRSRFRWWALWTAGVAGAVSGLLLLQTAGGTVVAAIPTNDFDSSGSILIREPLEWDSVASIENAVLDSNGKPTLVEFYTDFGFG
jgi:hypothetical protein